MWLFQGAPGSEFRLKSRVYHVEFTVKVMGVRFREKNYLGIRVYCLSRFLSACVAL